MTRAETLSFPSTPLSARLARRILSRVGENGKPPEFGVAHTNVGNESYLRLLDTVYLEGVLKDSDGSSFKLVQGTYGAGKTHFLYCVRDLAWQKNLLTALVTISPKERPLNKPLAVYQAVAQTLELGRARDEEEPVRGIDDVWRATLDARLARDGKDATQAWVDTSLARAPITVHAFRDALVQYAYALLEGPSAHEKQRTLSAWLRGEEVPLTLAKTHGVYEIPSNKNGFLLLRSLVQAVVRMGYEGSVLLFDEAERRLSVETKALKSTSESMDHLRELVDLCGSSELPRALLVYAVTPAFTEHVLPEYPALQQRLGSPVQYLSESNPRAPLIDLEALDLAPAALLREIGRRLLRVAKIAYDWSPTDEVMFGNLDLLARTVTDEQLEVSHRRLFVKLWVRALDDQRLAGERELSTDEIQALVRDEQADLLEEDHSEAGTFFGSPVPPRKP